MNAAKTVHHPIWCWLAMLACLASCADVLGIPEPSLVSGDPSPDPDAGPGTDPDAAQPVCVNAPAGVVAWWDGEVLGQDIAGSFSTSGDRGTPVLETGLVGNAMRFGRNDLLALDAAPTPPMFTVEGWVFVMNQDPTWIGIYGRFTESGLFVYDNQLTYWDGTFAIGSGEAGNLGQGATKIFEQWQHIACTWDGDTLRTYVNGALEGSSRVTTGQAALPSRAQIGGLINPNNQGLEDHFIGLIDELTVYSRALSESEISMIVAAAAQGKCKPSS